MKWRVAEVDIRDAVYVHPSQEKCGVSGGGRASELFERDVLFAAFLT